MLVTCSDSACPKLLTRLQRHTFDFAFLSITVISHRHRSIVDWIHVGIIINICLRPCEGQVDHRMLQQKEKTTRIGIVCPIWFNAKSDCWPVTVHRITWVDLCVWDYIESASPLVLPASPYSKGSPWVHHNCWLYFSLYSYQWTNFPLLASAHFIFICDWTFRTTINNWS